MAAQDISPNPQAQAQHTRMIDRILLGLALLIAVSNIAQMSASETAQAVLAWALIVAIAVLSYERGRDNPRNPNSNPNGANALNKE